MREIVSARVSMRERTGVCEGEALWERESVYVRENMREINYEWKIEYERECVRESV